MTNKFALLQLIINNVSLSPSTTQAFPSGITWGRQYIGKSPFSTDGSFVGSMEDFRIYNTVLTTTQITDIYNNLKPIAWYKFNDYLDSSGNGYNLTNSSTTLSNGVVSFASGQYLNIPTALNPYNIWNGNGITFSVWFRGLTADGTTSGASSSGTSAKLFEFATSDNLKYITIYQIGAGKTLRIHITDTTGYYYDTNEYMDNNWHHVAWTITSAGVWGIYIDNNYINPSKTQGIPNATLGQLYLGKSNGSAGSFIGSMDDFRIYNTVLSATQVSYIYQSNYIYNFTTNNNPIVWYKFNDYNDSSGNSYNLVNTSTTLSNGVVSFAAATATQYLNIPLSFNPYTTWYGNGITFSFWFNGSTTSGTYARLFDFCNLDTGSPTNYILISKNSTNNTLRFLINSTSFITPSNYFDSSWYHIVWTIDSGGV